MEYNVNFVYTDDKDRELIKEVPSKFPIFINFLNLLSANDRKQGFKVKSKWGAKKNPFIEVLKEDGKVDRCFYSENTSAVSQLIKWLNDDKNSN